MKKYLIYPIIGVLHLIFMAGVTVMTSISIYIVALLACIMPIKFLRYAIKRFLHRLPVYWIDLLGLGMRLTAGKRWKINGSGELDAQKPYLLISNHLSGIDILALSVVFHRKTPTMKFFMKKELLWTLPFAGLATWILGYPFMERHTSSQIRKNPELKNKDIETTQKACKKFIEYPSTIMNYVEGTRFSEEKRIQKDSPYEHLLKPKTTGIAIVINELHKELGGIIDATLAYKPQKMSFWKFACGDFEELICHYRLLPITPELLGNYYQDRQYRKQLQVWLNAIWQEKDHRLQTLYSE